MRNHLLVSIRLGQRSCRQVAIGACRMLGEAGLDGSDRISRHDTVKKHYHHNQNAYTRESRN